MAITRLNLQQIQQTKTIMKQFNFLTALFVLVTAATFTSCTGVDSGHRGVEVSWGGETNKNKVYGEGLQTGVSWLWNDMVEYDIREKTITKQFSFNDKNNMVTNVELALDYNLDPNKVNLLHMEITDVEIKILKTLKSAGKEVVPQYSAVELNITKRTEAEAKLSAIIAKELPEFYVEFARIQMTDVDIPAKVANLAEQTAVQLGKNELALKKEAEQKALAAASIAKAKGEFQAAEYEAKTRDILSTPKMIRLQEVENERIIAEGYKQHGKSIYGTNNWFGTSSAGVIKGLK